MRRRKYLLHCAFHSATLIGETDGPVEFEVSIGNYGNKLDGSVKPSSSTTQPTNAVYDGTYYHFLPWSESKPCTVVESHWEDISYRLGAVNMLLKMADRLVRRKV
ncbi:unnamed protein product [Protopolystoma xenopodis]|uniref:Uncharacterized protein n=1 Tax=Protopolystoma xenopodis TaxID=117903 RepID=A0A3S5CUT5_9PLAT|nr:unnamed protein product [Protopolystoma xenopodis]